MSHESDMYEKQSEMLQKLEKMQARFDQDKKSLQVSHRDVVSTKNERIKELQGCEKKLATEKEKNESMNK